jgi:multiple sugar transport system permease protein
MVGKNGFRRMLDGVGLYTAVFLYVAFALFPIYWTIKISVTPQKLLYSEGIKLWPSTMTLENFRSVLATTDFPRYFLNSLIVSFSTSIVVTAIASLAGYALSRFRFRGKTWVSLLLLLTQTFPLVMVIPPIFRIMSQLGLTNNLYGLIIIYTAFNIAFATFLMQSFFDAVPMDLEEAAMIDGCTRFTALRRIILPLTLPGMGACSP